MGCYRAVRWHSCKEDFKGRDPLQLLDDSLCGAPALRVLPLVSNENTSYFPVWSVGLVRIGVGSGDPNAGLIQVTVQLIPDLHPMSLQFHAPWQSMLVMEWHVWSEALHKAWCIPTARLFIVLLMHLFASHACEHRLDTAKAPSGILTQFGFHKRSQSRNQCSDDSSPASACQAGLLCRTAQTLLNLCVSMRHSLWLRRSRAHTLLDLLRRSSLGASGKHHRLHSCSS
mmetsp:Transcript_76339/g.210736  ORF Transcript_76339/g.210736 Transcript_76339/m.210736 type:complete len:228 (-) Transcript_76339:1280-1963(-)